MVPPGNLRCVIFDFAMTLCPDLFFKTAPSNQPDWFDTLQRVIFSDKQLLTRWCTGKIKLQNIAEILSTHFSLAPRDILNTMIEGCKNLHFNPAVFNFAQMQKQSGRKVALVTINMDVFTSIVAPAHNLSAHFDIIINSADFGTQDKTELWQIAFERLGRDFSYSSSLLIDDSAKWTSQFQINGGQVHQYKDDISFTRWVSDFSAF